LSAEINARSTQCQGQRRARFATSREITDGIFNRAGTYLAQTLDSLTMMIVGQFV